MTIYLFDNKAYESLTEVVRLTEGGSECRDALLKGNEYRLSPAYSVAPIEFVQAENRLVLVGHESLIHFLRIKDMREKIKEQAYLKNIVTCSESSYLSKFNYSNTGFWHAEQLNSFYHLYYGIEGAFTEDDRDEAIRRHKESKQ